MRQLYGPVDRPVHVQYGTAGVGFLYRIFLSRLAGAEGLGVYRLAYSAYIVLHAASLSGVTMACTRLSAEWSAQGKLGAVRILVRRAFQTFLVFFLSGASVLMLFREYIGEHVLGDARTVGAMPVMLICIGLTGIENVFKSTMIGLNRVDNAAASELTEQIVRIGATLAFLYANTSSDLGWIAVLIFAGMTVSECVSAYLMTRMYHGLRLPKACPPPEGARGAFLQIVLPVSLSALLSNVIASGGAVVLPMRLAASGLTRTEAVSELGVVSGIASPIMLLPIALLSSLCTVAMPEASRYASTKCRAKLQDFTGKTVFAAGIVGIPATMLLVPLAPAIGRLFFYRAVSPAYFMCIGISAIFCYYQMATGCLLNGIGRQQFAVMTALTGEVIHGSFGCWWQSGAAVVRRISVCPVCCAFIRLAVQRGAAGRLQGAAVCAGQAAGRAGCVRCSRFFMDADFLLCVCRAAWRAVARPDLRDCERARALSCGPALVRYSRREIFEDFRADTGLFDTVLLTFILKQDMISTRIVAALVCFTGQEPLFWRLRGDL